MAQDDPSPGKVLEILESDFAPTKTDEEVQGHSIEDRRFLTMLEDQSFQDSETAHNIVPLPFRTRSTEMYAASR